MSLAPGTRLGRYEVLGLILNWPEELKRKATGQ